MINFIQELERSNDEFMPADPLARPFERVTVTRDAFTYHGNLAAWNRDTVVHFKIGSQFHCRRNVPRELPDLARRTISVRRAGSDVLETMLAMEDATVGPAIYRRWSDGNGDVGVSLERLRDLASHERFGLSRYWRPVAGLLRRMSRAGYLCNDLHRGNVMKTAGRVPALRFIDFDECVRIADPVAALAQMFLAHAYFHTCGEAARRVSTAFRGWCNQIDMNTVDGSCWNLLDVVRSGTAQTERWCRVVCRFPASLVSLLGYPADHVHVVNPSFGLLAQPSEYFVSASTKPLSRMTLGHGYGDRVVCFSLPIVASDHATAWIAATQHGDGSTPLMRVGSPFDDVIRIVDGEMDTPHSPEHVPRLLVSDARGRGRVCARVARNADRIDVTFTEAGQLAILVGVHEDEQVRMGLVRTRDDWHDVDVSGVVLTYLHEGAPSSSDDEGDSDDDASHDSLSLRVVHHPNDRFHTWNVLVVASRVWRWSDGADPRPRRVPPGLRRLGNYLYATDPSGPSEEPDVALWTREGGSARGVGAYHLTHAWTVGSEAVDRATLLRELRASYDRTPACAWMRVLTPGGVQYVQKDGWVNVYNVPLETDPGYVPDEDVYVRVPNTSCVFCNAVQRYSGALMPSMRDRLVKAAELSAAHWIVARTHLASAREVHVMDAGEDEDTDVLRTLPQTYDGGVTLTRWTLGPLALCNRVVNHPLSLYARA